MRALTAFAGSGVVRCGASASGAPSTHVPSSVTSPDQRSDDMNGTSSRTVHGSAGSDDDTRAAARAAVVRFGVVTLRANAPRVASGSAPPGRSGSTSLSVSRPVVSVPVLSVHTTSTLLTDSTALTCCTSAPHPAIRPAPAV